MQSPAPDGEQEEGIEGVFVGRFTHSLDPKKRLTIPSEWRTRMGKSKSFYILPDVQERCLSVLPAREMARRLDARNRFTMGDREARQFSRTLASQSALLSWDSQGRIRITDELLAFADLTGQVIFLGAFKSFELWNPEVLNAAGALDRSSLEEAATRVGF